MPKVQRRDSLRTLGTLGIFLLAFLIRLVHIWQLRPSPFFSVLMGDARAYDAWAMRLAAGDWMGTEVFYQAPLYPYFLGGLYALFGRDLLIVRMVQAMLGSAACMLLAVAAARLFSPRAGVIAGLLLALYPPAIFLDALIQKSVLDVFLVCLTLWLISHVVAGKHTPHNCWAWFGLGLTLGALSLTRENALVLVLLVLIWSAVGDRITPATMGEHRVRYAGTLALLLGLLMVLLPVAARNAWVGGGFYLTTAQLGSNFYIGNNPRANGTYMSLREGREDPSYERQDATELAQQALGRKLSPGEVSTFWRDRALQFITSNPTAWLALIWRKLTLLMSATEMIDTEAQESHAEWSTPLQATSWIGHFGVLLPLAVVGVVLTWQERKRLLILYLMAVVYATSVLLFFVVGRYRYPLIPFLMLFAAAGLARLPGFVQRSTRNQQVALGVAVIPTALLTHAPALSTDTMRAITETNVGVALQEQGQLARATSHYRRATEIQPDYAPAYNNLGVALRAHGQRDEAISAYRKALAYRPDYPEVHYNLATVLLEQKKANDAIAHYRVALPSLPSTPGAHNNFGVALAAAGLADEAIVHFRAALALEPDSPITLRNLGDALTKQRRSAEALEVFLRIAELQPGNPAAHYDLGGLLMEAGKFSEAADEFRVVIRLSPDSPQAHNNLGVALAAQGRVEEAIPEFEKALALKPDFADAQRYLAMARREIGEVGGKRAGRSGRKR